MTTKYRTWDLTHKERELIFQTEDPALIAARDCIDKHGTDNEYILANAYEEMRAIRCMAGKEPTQSDFECLDKYWRDKRVLEDILLKDIEADNWSKRSDEENRESVRYAVCLGLGEELIPEEYKDKYCTCFISPCESDFWPYVGEGQGSSPICGHCEDNIRRDHEES